MVIISFVTLSLSFFTLLFLTIDYSQELKRNVRETSSKKIFQTSPPEGCQLDGERKSFPDLDYVMFGYNILRGYPLAVGHDPGLTHPIFRHDYSKGKHTADCRYHVPEGYILAADVSCVTSFSSKVIKDSNQFVKSITVSAQATGEGWGASFSASSEYKKKTSEMSSSESVFVYSQAKCNYYFAMMDEINPPPFHKSFLYIIQNMKSEKDFHHFFDYYGTHFLSYALFGAKFVYENKMAKETYQKEIENHFSISLQASYSGIFSLSGGFGLTNNQKEIAQNFKEKVETSSITIGAPPPDDGKTATWASTVKNNPVPVEYKLKPILELFTEKYMGGLGVDFQEIRHKLEKAKLTYCSSLLKKGEVNTCKQLTGGYIIFDGIYLGRKYFTVFKSSFKMCSERCSDNMDCQAASFDSITFTCFMYRASNTTILDVSMSPKVKSLLFKDSLKLLDKTLYLQNVRFPTEVSRETSGLTSNSSSCNEKCTNDKVCFANTFRTGEVKTNCLLYQEKNVIANSLKFEKNAITAIHVTNKKKKLF